MKKFGTKKTVKYFLTLSFLFFSTVLILSGCSNDSEVKIERKRTVIAYLNGDVNLWYELERSINLFEEGWVDGTDGTLLIYLDCSPHLTQFGVPVLLEVCHDETDAIVSRVVKIYPDQDAMDPQVFKNVLTDARNMYPAQSHGLIIGTHGSGWWPGNLKPHDITKALGGPERYGSSLEVSDLAKSLPGHYEFIIFHACLMSNIETVYQLRNNCDYIMSSILPLPGPGYPYDIITSYLFTQPHADLYNAAKKSVESYKKMDIEDFEEFSVQVIKTSKLNDLAKKTTEFLKDLNLKNMQIDNIFSEYNVVTYGDLYNDMIHILALEADGKKQESLYKALNDVVIYNEFVLSEGDKPKYKLSSGLSFYLPKSKYPEENAIYNSDYDWSKDSGFGQNN